MKKKIIGFTTGLLLLCIASITQATLITIGTATYGGSEYNLIWDDDNNGNSIVWLDYSTGRGSWESQLNWASSIGSQLTVLLNQRYKTDIDWSTGWRLPSAGTNPFHGFNDNMSEMGHLYYEELKNDAYENGSPYPTQNHGPFNNIFDYVYQTEDEQSTPYSWNFNLGNGQESYNSKSIGYHGIAVHNAQISTVPLPSTIWLLGSCLVGLAGMRRKKM